MNQTTTTTTATDKNKRDCVVAEAARNILQMQHSKMSAVDPDALVLDNEAEFISFHDMATEIMKGSPSDPLTVDKEDSGMEYTGYPAERTLNSSVSGKAKVKKEQVEDARAQADAIAGEKLASKQLISDSTRALNNSYNFSTKL